MPLASHSLGYMLNLVNPGIVLISFTVTRSVCRSTKKSTRAMPQQSIARKAQLGQTLKLMPALVAQVRRDVHLGALLIQILRLVIVELASIGDLTRYRNHRIVIA